MIKQCKLQHIGPIGESRHRDTSPKEAENRIASGRTKYKKYFMPRFSFSVGSQLLLPVLILLLGFSTYAIGAATPDREEKEVLKTVRKFLDAEIRRDYPAVYACFAPSSVYLQTHNYQQYLDDARSAPYHVVEYQIVRVSFIRDNNDPKSISTADRIAQVEVEVTFAYEGSNRRSVVNIGFIFLKEGGKWYKS